MKEQSPRSIQWRFAALPGVRILQQAVAKLPPRAGATEKDRCLAEERGEAICLFPALTARRLAVVVQVGEAGHECQA